MIEYNKNHFEELTETETTDREKIFRLLLKFLDSNKIIYAVLGPRDLSTLNISEEGDIDFVISKKNFKKISFYIHKFCRQNNFIPVQIRKHESTACIFVLSYYHSQQKKFKHIKVDFCSDYIKRGR